MTQFYQKPTSDDKSKGDTEEREGLEKHLFPHLWRRKKRIESERGRTFSVSLSLSGKFPYIQK